MNLKSLEITEEEKEALKTYCEYEHSYINLLVSGNIKVVKKFNNDQLDTFSPKYFEKSMDVLNKIYSAMCKYSYGQDTILRLSRGTTVAEVESLKEGECTKLLSTSANEESAKAFAGSKVINEGETEKNDRKAALVRIKAINIPMINVNKVLGSDSNHERESEIILSPFIKLKGLSFTSHWNDIYYYDGEAEVQELTQVEDMEQLHKEIAEEISEIPKLVKEYAEYKRGLEMYNSYATRTDIDDGERELIESEKESCNTNLKRVEEKFNSIRSKMVQYAKGMCFETRQKVMEQIKAESEEIKQVIGKKHNELSSELTAKSLELSECIREFTTKCEEYKTLSEKLGLYWKSSVSNSTLKTSSNNVLIGMSYMTDSLYSIENIENCESKLVFIEEIIKSIQTKVADYNDAKLGRYIRIQLDEKLQQIIREEERKKLDAQKEKLEMKRGGIFNKILGRDKEIELEIKQLELRKMLLTAKPIHGSDSNTIHQILARILQYKNKDGVLPEKLATMEQQIRSVFEINDDEVKAQLMDMTQPVALIPVKQEKSTIFNRKRRIDRIKEENQGMIQDIQNTKLYTVERQKIDLEDELITDIPEKINEYLDRIHKITKGRNRQVQFMK